MISSISYFSASVLAYLGLLAGAVLAKLSPEEVAPMRKYQLILRKLLVLIIPLPMFFFFTDAVQVAAAIFISLALWAADYANGDFRKKIMFNYIAMGVLFFMGAKETALFATTSALVLLYGFPSGSLLYDRKKGIMPVLASSIWFLVIANVLYSII